MRWGIATALKSNSGWCLGLGLGLLGACSHPSSAVILEGTPMSSDSGVLSHLQPFDDKQPPPGNVQLHIEPADAVVSIDGVEQGQASDFDGEHRNLQLTEGAHRLKLSKSGYTTVEMTVYATLEGRQRVAVSLSKP